MLFGSVFENNAKRKKPDRISISDDTDKNSVPGLIKRQPMTHWHGCGGKKGSVPALAALEQRGEVGIVATQSAIGLGRRPDCLYRSGRGGVKGHTAAWLAGLKFIDKPSQQFRATGTPSGSGGLRF
ncbi:hypothetical protein Zmor_010408 [Zophobas morio]|uniref:Uncharacterized protein n=1 Tax=Zophobas morio TaxID=2755281 RepID=A0AA38INN1_9CUCU|nr:hypothetical protein Zmor_010408 [Zophobas morio]